MFELTEQNFTLYAIKHYDNPACKGMTEFYDDLGILKGYLENIQPVGI